MTQDYYETHARLISAIAKLGEARHRAWLINTPTSDAPGEIIKQINDVLNRIDDASDELQAAREACRQAGRDFKVTHYR